MRRSLAAVPVALLLVAGCSDSGKPATTTLKTDFGAQLRSAVAKGDSTSSKLDLTIATSASGTDVTINGTGAFDGNVGSMVITVAGQSIEERLTGGNLYMKVPGQTKWYVLKLTDLVGTSLAESASPGDSAKVLLAADNNVTKVGDDTVRGADTTHYKGTIPLDEKHLAKIGGFARGAVQKLVDGGVTSIPFDAWLDKQGRLVKMTEALDVTVKGTAAHVTTTLERYDFGTKVAVVAPPKSEQADGAAFLSALKSATG